MKKGQVYRGIIESVEFPNKGRIYVPEEDRSGSRKERRAGTESKIFCE